MPGIAVISAPRSAPAFLGQLIQRVAGPLEARAPLQVIHGRAVLPELDFNAAREIRSTITPVFIHHHALPNKNTLSFLSLSELQPVILWRDIGDSMVSLTEEWERQWRTLRHQIDFDGSHLQFLGDVPLVFIDRFMKADWPMRYDMTIDLALPWYCQFMAGWRDARGILTTSYSYSTFEKLADNPVYATNRILIDLCLRTREKVSDAVKDMLADPAMAQFAIEPVGRGRELLTEAQQARIARVWSYFDNRPALE